MVGERVQRRLAAILAADVVGYSRLIEQDEAGTLAVLKARRKEVLEPLVAQHQGRIFKIAGDGVLVEFGSAVNAVQCAVDLQHAFASANANVPGDRHIVLRIGVNLGDVMVEGGDLYGEGVNIASRLEGVAEPGGVVISGTAHDHIGTRIKVGFEDLGPQCLKNIAQPVRAYGVIGTPAVAVAASKPASDKPSIAVLPFTNMSDDPNQQYFSDGITEDIITELSRFSSLFVIARNSSFQHRGRVIDARRVAHELGVQYVVEGSVRKAGANVRITSQLIDARTGNHLWAERYDRGIQDIFTVQDEVVHTIAATLAGRVVASGAEQAKRRPMKDWVAYDYFLQGRARDANFDPVSAETLFRRAIELDPSFAPAHAWRALVLASQCWQDPDLEKLRQAEASARTALSLDGHDVWGHDAMAVVGMLRGQFDLAGVHLDRAENLNPNDPLVGADRANWLVRTGRPKEALAHLDAAMQRDPFPAEWLWSIRFLTLFHLKRYDEAILALQNMTTMTAWSHVYLVAAHAQAGRLDEARRELGTFLQIKPGISLSGIVATEHYADRVMLDHLLEGLRKAGLPE